MKRNNIVLAKNIQESIIESVTDGEGIRLVIYTCGCPRTCKNCQNKFTQDINNGIVYSISEVFEYIDTLIQKRKDFYDGITLSGGDPIYQEESVEELLILFKNKYPNLDIWLYTGYLYEEVKDKDIMKYIDVLVDGPFVEELKGNYRFKGSSNQKIINLSNNN